MYATCGGDAAFSQITLTTCVNFTRTWAWPVEPRLEQTNPDALVSDSGQRTQVLLAVVCSYVLVKTRQNAVTTIASVQQHARQHGHLSIPACFATASVID